MTLSKKQINEIAIIHSGIQLKWVDGFMFDDDSNISEIDKNLIIEQINKIADMLLNGRPSNLPSTNCIIEYVLKNK